jgi:hypothetical protein
MLIVIKEWHTLQNNTARHKWKNLKLRMIIILHLKILIPWLHKLRTNLMFTLLEDQHQQRTYILSNLTLHKAIMHYL